MKLPTKVLPQEPRASIISVLRGTVRVSVEDKIRAWFPKEENSKSLVYLAGDATCRARP
jgi:hypothetical protein